MGNSFQFLDIIFFAMIAAFLVLRLRSVLGRRDAHRRGHGDPFAAEPRVETADDNVVPLTDQSGEPSEEDGIAEGPGIPAGVARIRRVDREFSQEGFLEGAQVAFEAILGAFASGDRATLQALLSPEVFANFNHAIEDRERNNHTLDETLVGIKSGEIVEADMHGRLANVTVKFVSDQIAVTRNDEGDIVEGDPNTVTEVTDFWTFSRDTQSRDPNWTLIATRSLD